MSEIHASIACNLDADILSAAIPLFESEKVAAIEWSFDTLFHYREISAWFEGLLQAYSQEGRLIGHGVFFSVFSGKWLPDQEKWLESLRQKSRQYQFSHITEHFGFMTGEDFHKGAPISIPYTPSTLAIGIDRLKRISDACQCPVGLENLAFAYSLEEVRQHGEFLERLVSPVNGFIILDLHNLYCQLHNFDINFDDLIDCYPLDRVREIHISGGSWENSAIVPGKRIRRDTHDDAVPLEVFQLLQKTIPRCPELEYVVLEQLGIGLKTDADRAQFQKDFYTMEKIISKLPAPPSSGNDFLPEPFHLQAPVEDLTFYQQQLELSHILEESLNYDDASKRLQSSSLSGSAWEPENWHPAMLETAIAIAKKWKDGFYKA